MILVKHARDLARAVMEPPIGRPAGFSSIQSAGKQPAVLADQVGPILGLIEHFDHQLARAGAQRAAIAA